MTMHAPATAPGQDPVEILEQTAGPAVMAVITGVEGPSYRPVGAVMTVLGDARRVGTLSSGCIESDISLHAQETVETGKPRSIRYGRGSPFIDIQLPCGGGLDILLLPQPDLTVIRALNAERKARRHVALKIDPETGAMELLGPSETGWAGDHFVLSFEPRTRFLVFGKGPEASTFAGLVNAAGYPNLLLSPDHETLALGASLGCPVREISSPKVPEDVEIDAWTAITLFFHDHDWEPPVLLGALASPAFYIGAQGSRRARDLRMMELRGMGASDEDCARLHGPVGIIPSARDAETLAVSVLAEILAERHAARK